MRHLRSGKGEARHQHMLKYLSQRFLRPQLDQRNYYVGDGEVNVIGSRSYDSHDLSGAIYASQVYKLL